MRSDSRIFKLVYEYYEARILYGFYRYGDSLPSITKICEIFYLAPATVRMALAQLEKKGYIKIDARKAARVIYDADPATFCENGARYFVPRKEGIMDLTYSGKLLFEPLWEAGLRRFEESEWDELRKEIIQPSDTQISMIVEFYIVALSALDNKLILNFYWEMVRYVCFPYLGKEKRISLKLKDISKNEVISALRNVLENSYDTAVSNLFKFIDESRTRFHLENVEQIPFRWDIYRQRPQLRYTLVSDIIREISHGTYPKNTYLPSLPKMAEIYGVGQNTVRRALSILESLGVTKSYQGKGTLVSLNPSEIDFSRKEVEEGMRMYWESLQLLALTIRGVSVTTFQSVTKEELSHLAGEFSRVRHEGKSYLSFEIYFIFIEEKCPLAMVRECYGKLRGLLAWGYPFTLLRFGEQSLHDQYDEIIGLAEADLREGRLEEFGDNFRSLIEWQQQEIDSGNVIV
ncbi:GntR family transcriptional regulator [Blautia schinkii]|nr:GntR family transcriptional regulator [Blautia schinkii]